MEINGYNILNGAKDKFRYDWLITQTHAKSINVHKSQPRLSRRDKQTKH